MQCVGVFNRGESELCCDWCAPDLRAQWCCLIAAGRSFGTSVVSTKWIRGHVPNQPPEPPEIPEHFPRNLGFLGGLGGAPPAKFKSKGGNFFLGVFVMLSFYFLEKFL